jgi:hypothetical protein
MQYLRARRQELGGFVPQRSVLAPPIKADLSELFLEFEAGSEGREVSTTMAFVSMLRKMMRDPEIGKLVVPIQALHRPIAQRQMKAIARRAIGDDSLRLLQQTLIVVELAARNIRNGKVRRVHRRELPTQRLEDHILKAICVHLAAGVLPFQVAGVIPPLRQVAVRRLILRKAHRRQGRCLGRRRNRRQMSARCNRARHATSSQHYRQQCPTPGD